MSKLNNILIVETNKFNALNLKKVLTSHIHEDLSIQLKPDCDGLFDELDANLPDVLLFDLMADENPGNETISQIHSQHPQLPIIFILDGNEEIPQEFAKFEHIKYISRTNRDELQIASVVDQFISRQKAERDVLNVGDKFKAVFENLAVGIALVDLNGIPLEVNSRLAEFLGYSQSELKRMKFSEFTHPDDIVKDVQLFQEMIAGEIHDYSIEKRYLRKDGQVVWAKLDVSIIRDNEGIPLYAVSIVRDIADELVVRKKLEKERLHFSALMDHMPDRIYFKDKESKFTRVNKAFLVKHEMASEKEPKGKTDYDLFDKAHADKARDDEIKIMESGESLAGMIQLETYKDQEPTWSYTTKCPLKNENGEIIGTFGMSSDITKMIEAEKKLEESEARLRSLYDNLSIGVYRADMDGKFTFANPAILKMLGFSSDEELQTLDFESHGYVDKNFRQKFLERLVADGEINAYENAWKLKSGEIIYLRESAKLHRDEQGNPIYYEGTVEDVTQKRQAEERLRKYTEELQALNESKDKFFSIIAHDLRSPFTALLGYSDIIFNDYDDMEADEVKQYAHFINEEANNVYNLLDNLLTWSRIQTGRIKYNPDELELSELVKRTLGLYRESAKNKGISLVQELSGSDEIYSDENMVYTAIRNLLSNALKFTNEGGTIKLVSFEDETGMLRIGVQDDGIGMSEEDQAKLFRTDVHHTTLGTGQEKGTGLGLLLCKDLVEKNGGKIWVESEKGVGTTFWFTVPLKTASQKSES